MARKAVQKNISYDDQKQCYYAYFNYGTDRSGRRDRRAKTFRTLEEAEEALLDFTRNHGTGRMHGASHITLEEWLEYWIEEVVGPNRAYTTYYCYRAMIKNHIIPILGKIKLQNLEPWQIQQYYTRAMRESGLDPNSVHKHHILLHTALKLAFRQGLLKENPVERVEAPREHPVKQVYYTPKQLKQLFERVEGTWLELVVKLGAYLGLRRGEICGLRWENIDFRQKIIKIRMTRTTAGGHVIEKGPKTENSIRTLGIGGVGELLDLLLATRQHQMQQKERLGQDYCDSGYVITHENGRPRHPNTVTLAFHNIVKKHGLPPITVHGLRHTFASVANHAHVPLVDIGKALGHKDVSITGRVYTHIFDQTHQEVLSTVAAQIEIG